MTIDAFQRPAERAGSKRIDLVDAARGTALIAMFAYHFAWDLSFFRLIRTDVVAEPGWRWFAHLIAGSFLALVGASLVLATRQGLDLGAFLRRLGLVAGAAALVTLGTWFFMPESYVFFGILHHIAVASVLALPFLRLPPVVVALAAAVAFALPAFAATGIFDSPWLIWLGLGRRALDSGDFVPLFPWFGCVLVGVAAAGLALRHVGEERLAVWRASSQPFKVLAWGGRHSLPLYLVHQPLFIGLLSALLWLMPAANAPQAADPETQPFLRSCEQSCVRAGQPAEICREACTCTADGLRRDNLWRQALSGQMSTAERERTAEIARACYRQE
jgi:uncharacterized membrane protein